MRLISRPFIAAAVLCTAIPRVGGSQSGRIQGTRPDSAAAIGAPVVLLDDTLFSLTGRLGPFTAAQRAAAVSQRLGRLALGGIADTDSVVVLTSGTYTDVLVGNAVIMTVVDDDGRSRGLTRAAVAEEDARIIRRALATTGLKLTTRAIVLDTTYAAVATVVLIMLLAIFAFGFSRIYTRLRALRDSRHASLRIQRLELLSADRLADGLMLVARGVRVAVTIMLLYVYVPLVLSFFPWTLKLSQSIVAYALTPLGAAWTSGLSYLPDLFYVALIVIVTRFALRLMHVGFRALERGALSISGFHSEWAEPTYKIARVFVLGFAAVVLFPHLPGAHTDAFKGVSIFFGVLLSFGSSSAMGNVVAGIVLTYTRAFHIGDRVQIGDTVGDVLERTLLVTRVRTIKNVDITIPNGAVLAGHIINFSAAATEHGLILHTTVTIGYNAPWRKVHELLIAAAQRTEHILAAPAPFVLQTALNDFFVSYQINAYTDQPSLMAVTYSELHTHIQDAFNEAGVEIMSPHYRAFRDGNQSTIPSPPASS